MPPNTIERFVNVRFLTSFQSYFGIHLLFILAKLQSVNHICQSVLLLSICCLFVSLPCVVLFGLMATRLNKHYYSVVTICFGDRVCITVTFLTWVHLYVKHICKYQDM